MPKLWTTLTPMTDSVSRLATSAMLSWEGLNPAPLPGERPGDARGRIRQGWFAQKALAYIAPEFFAIHPVEYDMPEEDVLLLDMSFMSQSAEATMHVPSYAAWLEGQDNTPAYAYLCKLMKILHWQQPAKRWVLKSPHHMEYLDVILDVFPDSTIVQTHRDPRKTMASFSSMVAHGAGVFSDYVDPAEIAEHWVRKVERLMRLSIEVREGRDADRFVDVSYYDLVKDPIPELQRIYAAAGIPFEGDSARAVGQQRKRTVQHKYGRHAYALEDFGLDPERIEETFGFYRTRYGIPIEDAS